MIRPEPQVVTQMAQAVRQYPELLRWLQEWRMHELERLPNAVDSTGVYQGRCQVLGELTKFATDAPNLAATL